MSRFHRSPPAPIPRSRALPPWLAVVVAALVPRLTSARDAVSPTVEVARDRLGPYVDSAREVVTPHLDEARDRLVPVMETALDTTRHVANERLLPAVTAAAAAAYEGAGPAGRAAVRRGDAAVSAIRAGAPDARRNWPTSLALILFGVAIGALIGMRSRRRAPEAPWAPPAALPTAGGDVAALGSEAGGTEAGGTEAGTALPTLSTEAASTEE